MSNYKTAGISASVLCRKLIRATHLFAIAILLTASADAAQAKGFAKLDKVSGKVVVLDSAGSPIAKGSNGRALRVNEGLRTGADSSADILLFDGSRIRMTPNSKIKLSAKSKNGKADIQIDLISGKLFNLVQATDKRGHYVIKTKSAMAGFKGRVFSAESNGDQSVFMVKDGKLKLVNPKVSKKDGVLVSNMSKSTVSADARPAKPVPLSPEEIALFDALEEIDMNVGFDLSEETQDVIRENAVSPVDSLP
ncbi:MAG: FecR domain-containing protein [Candidatus Nitrohelix vancouverensis]|uniref:FecR domain-containing protein n=1 Tax=Candidatus Nitrohelix vancouverensis TaxID=2705534 RepID=A0A7T0C1I6_9BACT|nr:MAG: FecR domain-containing protein [Candidatus Nitrohelix vancouverensis]